MPTATIGGAKLFYRDEGSGEPLLLIHAFPLNSAMWEPQIAACSFHARVIAPDLPGFGQSILGSGEKSLARYADTLVALLDHLALPRVAVVGLSMGGYITFALLRHHAERVSKLVLADTKATADSDEAKAKRAENAQIVLEQGHDALADRVLPTLFGANTPEVLRNEVLQMIRANTPEGIAIALRAMAARADATDLLAGIGVPTVVIVGEHDTLTPLADAERLAAAIPGAKLSLIPGAAHLSNVENPEAFNSAVLDLIGRG